MKQGKLVRAARNLAAALLLAPALALAAGGGIKLDKSNHDLNDQASLQRGAQSFVTYCLNCHSANYMRFNRLTDIGLSEQQIKDTLLPPGQKVGDTMTIAMDAGDAKRWFGATPPDLSVIARSRGADWLYTYLRGFYRDDSRPAGWNNTAFPAVGMPHVLYELQGEQVMEQTEGGQGKLSLAKPGKLQPAEYDAFVTDMVNYLVYMGEPNQTQRVRLGMIVMVFLFVLLILAYLLKKEYWKDIH